MVEFSTDIWRSAVKSILSITMLAWSIALACPPCLSVGTSPGLLIAQLDIDRPGPGIVGNRPNGGGRARDLLAQMRRVSSYMEQYSVQNNGFYDQEMINATIVQLNQLVSNNPYSRGDMTAPDDELFDQTQAMDNGGQEISQNKRVNLIVDESMTDLQAEEYRSNPPDEWNGPPGAITVITNNRNMFLVYGDGRDGHPIKNPDTGRCAVIFGHYHMYLHGDI